MHKQTNKQTKQKQKTKQNKPKQTKPKQNKPKQTKTNQNKPKTKINKYREWQSAQGQIGKTPAGNSKGPCRSQQRP